MTEVALEGDGKINSINSAGNTGYSHRPYKNTLLLQIQW